MERTDDDPKVRRQFVPQVGECAERLIPSGRRCTRPASFSEPRRRGTGSIIGVVTERHPKMVVMRTRIGGTRVVDLHPGEILPRIC